MLDSVAELRDEPEAALPQTTGEDEEDGADAEISEGDAHSAETPAEDPAEEDLPEDGVPANLEVSASSRAWLMKDQGTGHSDGDIAQAARTFLAKEAVKVFSPAEQAEIIGEGEDDGTLARNLGALDLAGTHYLGLEEALASEEDDDAWLG